MMGKFKSMSNDCLGGICVATYCFESISNKTLPPHCIPQGAGNRALELGKPEIYEMSNKENFEPTERNGALPKCLVHRRTDPNIFLSIKVSKTLSMYETPTHFLNGWVHRVITRRINFFPYSTQIVTITKSISNKLIVTTALNWNMRGSDFQAIHLPYTTRRAHFKRTMDFILLQISWQFCPGVPRQYYFIFSQCIQIYIACLRCPVAPWPAWRHIEFWKNVSSLSKRLNVMARLFARKIVALYPNYSHIWWLETTT